MSRIIRGDEAEGARRWNIPSVEQPAGRGPARNYDEGFASVCAQIPTQKDIEELKKRAWDEAFKQGLQDGRTQALAESDNLLSVARNLLEQLSEPMRFIDLQVRQQLVALTVAISKQIIKAELNHEADFILKLIEQALVVLPDSPAAIYVHMHPADAAAVRAKLEQSDKRTAWSIVEDASMEAGGCKVFTDNTSVDLSLDAQLARIAAKFLDDDDNDEPGLDQLSI